MWSSYAIYLVCLAFFGYFMVKLVLSYIDPSTLKTTIAQKSLADMDFPLVFKVCVKPGYDLEGLNALGYGDIFDYFKGLTGDNDDFVGWAGKDDLQNATALWEAVRLVRSPEDVLLKVGVVSFSSLETTWSGASLASLAVPGAWPTIRNCLSLDLAPALALQGDTINIKTVKFTFKPSDSSLEVLLEDRAMATDREIAENSLYTSGHSIARRSLSTSRELGEGWATFMVQIDENVFVEGDPTTICQNYPDLNHQSYNDCDKNFLKKTLASNFGPEFVPIWASNSSSVSAAKSVNSSLDLAPLFNGHQTSPCPRPCRTTRITSRLLTERYDDESIVEIVFSSTVTVTTTDFVQFSLVTFLSDTGGAMGLWLGLGIIQLLELIVKFGAMGLAGGAKRNKRINK